MLGHHGWSLDRISGAHQIHGKPGRRVKIPVPAYRDQSLGKGLQRS
ncbi:MAG: type II toxin-antitoxin system HicA family toxin [Planctomycetaceae bacterium]